MGLVVLTGGARSGKSRMAQRLASDLQARGHAVTVIVFGVEADAEMVSRIERHRADRPEGFEVVEVDAGDDSWLAQLSGEQAVLVDCLGSCVSGIMSSAWEALRGDAPGADENTLLKPEYVDRVESAVARVVDALCAAKGATIVVTNEVGEGVVPEWASARLFRDLMGRSNSRLVANSDAGYLCVAGRAVDIRGLPGRIIWPED
ncbi:MAG: bifunctional adenosylcobinamide kinase/adenosylcobinamide-phosphate guanylyltransferase [Coriobacteriia bacterium]|nr:bifunctional adenosylcobinamide kinase/adenosylcobinamide-phosphate guanylyltransferase [Coriobacteriia bacterium]